MASSAESRIEQNLARLRALRVVYVGDLIVQPGESRARAAAQLEAFTEIAEAAVREASATTSRNAGDIAGYLAQLRTLEVVEIGDLIEQRPPRSGRCWGACPDDRAAANAVNTARADRLQRIVAAELAARSLLVDGEGE